MFRTYCTIIDYMIQQNNENRSVEVERLHIDTCNLFLIHRRLKENNIVSFREFAFVGLSRLMML